MLRRTLIKDHLQEAILFKHRAWVAAVFCLFFIIVLLVRLFNLQVLEYQHFDKLSENNRVRLMAIAPNRGLIFDRNGVVLAENRPSYRLEVIPEQVNNMEWLLVELGKLVELDEADIKRFRKAIKRSRPFEGIPLRTKLSDDEVARLAVNRHQYPGMEITARLSRYYPLGESAAHVTGYVGRIDEDELKNVNETQYAGTSHIGKTGLERYYESELHGEVGHQSVEVNVQGRILRVLEKKQPVPGKDLILSLDVRLQSVAEKALGDYNGAVVVMDPNTGEVLALVSMPGYDPNLFVHGISRKDYRRLQNPDTRPLYNRALYGQYPPGSTLKPFVGLAGLENKVIGHKESIPCEGYYLLPNEERKYRDWKKTGHGHVDLEDSLAQSCDVYYYELSYRLGIDRIHAFLQQFGFGKATGVDIQGERSGLLPSREWKQRSKNKIWFPGETLIAGIGQGYMLTTPMQLASATSILAMRGQGFKPHLLKEIHDPATGDGRQTEIAPLPAVKLNRQMNWNHIVNGMVSVVHGVKGTARQSGRRLKFKMAGKTGTAQVFGVAQDEEYDEDIIAKKHRDHALFVAFAPVDKPEIAIAVIAENGSSGSGVAAPIARKVLDAWIETQEQK
ncbi:MAG: penicillin-binding protein 2 [Gammaproteobacteria bacterium]|nr:penicillin-binding protein 2 [Gammaproteobacteria bacterium]MCW8910682.1 penicillin-binding protein 2 [Gammaproteobacteria bacterium]MCW9006057.1 penicillin-binding protein 2 [Gammaproteobacteria bacterium]MCW9056279.1 penicillin-binding protein 2 [Gammaproteobacteria bacterium]